MTGNDIRQRFLDYFPPAAIAWCAAARSVPANDPTLLFTNAGMNQFKDVFQGQETRDYTRAASSQKCVRAGGKHNDLENVGYTRRHHTFFEMLGNFSFGDYFKGSDRVRLGAGHEGIRPPQGQLYVTVFREDDEAERLWQRLRECPKTASSAWTRRTIFGRWVTPAHAVRAPRSSTTSGPRVPSPAASTNNFRSTAEDASSKSGTWSSCSSIAMHPAAITPLPRPSIDTGMGLERIAAVMQGKISNYDTDLIWPIIERASEICGVAIGADPKVDTVLRINADHARATAFLIHDGVLPSNEGRGYVLRKIMRRAMRNARLIGNHDPYLYQLTGFVAELMHDAYPEMHGSPSSAWLAW